MGGVSFLMLWTVFNHKAYTDKRLWISKNRNVLFGFINPLRPLTEGFMLVGSAIFDATFNLITRVGLP